METNEYIEISEKVRSGEYFREVRRVIDSDLHDPMTDRYWYILLTIPSVIIVIIVIFALQSLYPLNPEVPFIYGINDIMEDSPHIKSLIEVSGEGADAALQRFVVSNYVKEREEYNVANFDRNQIALQILSSKPVFEEYLKSIALDNPNSPIVLYQRRIARNVKILFTQLTQKPDKNQQNLRDYAMRVVYEATLTPESKENPPTRGQVDVNFKYEPIKIDEKTEKIIPYGFLVTGYNITHNSGN